MGIEQVLSCVSEGEKRMRTHETHQNRLVERGPLEKTAIRTEEDTQPSFLSHNWVA